MGDQTQMSQPFYVLGLYVYSPTWYMSLLNIFFFKFYLFFNTENILYPDITN